jgi:hypothetical protein
MDNQLSTEPATLPLAAAHFPLEYRTAQELRAMAEYLRTTADANTHSMHVWTELLAIAAYYDNLADRVAD